MIQAPACLPVLLRASKHNVQFIFILKEDALYLHNYDGLGQSNISE